MRTSAFVSRAFSFVASLAVVLAAAGCPRSRSTTLTITVEATAEVGAVDEIAVTVSSASGMRQNTVMPFPGPEFTFPATLPNMDLTGLTGLASVEVTGRLAGADVAMGTSAITLVGGAIPVSVLIDALDVDECTDGTDDCGPDATCTNTIGSFTCACNPGYAGDGITCTDVDECTDATDDCSPDASCVNAIGSFTCTCNAGFIGDGVTCTDDDECTAGTANCDVNATCTNIAPGFVCACDTGYYGDGVACLESFGQVIFMGHDFFSRNSDVDTIIGNAVLQATTFGDITVLGYDEFADVSPTGEPANADAAIMDGALAAGRTVTITRVSDYLLLGSMLPSADVLVIYEMELGGDGFTIGATLSSALQSFLDGGGIIIAMDYYSQVSTLLTQAGVMRILGQYTGYGDTPLTVTISTDPVMAGVPTPMYTGTNGTGSFITDDGAVLAIDDNGLPVLVHKYWNKLRFDGTVGAAWEVRSSNSDSTGSLMSYHPDHIVAIYNMYGANGQRYLPGTDTWMSLANPLPYSNYWFNMAAVGRRLYGFPAYETAVRSINLMTGTWSVLATWTGTSEYSAAVEDESGMIWGYLSNGNLMAYNPMTNGIAYYATGFGSQYETRIAYDPPSRKLYFGSYSTPDLHSFDIDTLSSATLTPIPEVQLNDIFCGDRSGHIYAAGDYTGTTMWQYDIATDTWLALPDFPIDHGNNGSCVVSDSGYLYVSSGATDFYRLPLF